MEYHGVYHLEEFQVPVLLWPRPFSQVTPHQREKENPIGPGVLLHICPLLLRLQSEHLSLRHYVLETLLLEVLIGPTSRKRPHQNAHILTRKMRSSTDS